MGKDSMGNMSNNGERMWLSWRKQPGIWRDHYSIHKQTWRSPNGRTTNQIDLTLIKWKHSLHDVWVIRGADIGSDHYLLIAKVKLKLRKAKTGNKTWPRFDTDKLINLTTQQRFQVSLRNNFRILQNRINISILEYNQAIEQTGKGTWVQTFKERRVALSENLGSGEWEESNQETAPNWKVTI